MTDRRRRTTPDRPPRSTHPSRRDIVRGGALLAGGLGASGLVGASGAVRVAADGPSGDGIVIGQGTNLKLSHDAASSRLAMDTANVLWVLPQEGGRARRLTEDEEDATYPVFLPGGDRVVFQSFRYGSYDICSVDVATGEVERHTFGPQHDVEPAVCPRGERIAYVSDDDGTSAVWILDIGTGETGPVVGTGDTSVYRTPTWHPEGEVIAYIVDGERVETLDLSLKEKDTAHRAPEGGELWAVSYGPSGRLAHVLVEWPYTTLFVDGEPLTRPPDEPAALPPTWASADEIVHGMDGEIRRLSVDGTSKTVTIPFSAVLDAAGLPPRLGRPVVLPAEFDAQGIASPVLSPDGEGVCFRALGAIWHLRWGGEPERIIGDGAFNTDPSWFPDGRSIVYSSDRTGVPNLWRHTLGENIDEQLTDLETGAFVPSVAPDGARVVFQDEEGATFVLGLNGGRVRKVGEPTYRPGRPSWSPDGCRVAMAVTAPVSPRDDSGHNRCSVVDLASGENTVHAVAEHRSIATRGDDGPVWLPDGENLVAVIDSQVHRIPVDETGKPTGDPVLLSELVADSVSVSSAGDVLFLSLGELVLLRGEGEETERHPPRLKCRRREAAPPRVVRAGALWDGTSDEYRRNVDITVRDGVIESVTDADMEVEPDLDASGRSVTPGFIDTHNHWHLHGRQWGSRQGPLWLAYGVTTSRSPGDPAYQMVETREAIHSGAVIGPRFLGSGEALDGRRCYFGFMRCVSSEAQLELEVQRVLGLGYNVVKSYQHFPVYLEHELVERMREEEVPVVSHYLYPALSTGLNGMEHTGGGNRLGYSRTLSFAGGRTAEDTVSLLAGSHMWVSSTLLFANELFRDSLDLVEDERTRVMFPAWEYERLLDKVEAAEGPHNDLNEAWTEGDVDLLLRVHREGGTVVAGTDAPLDDIGISIHQNLRAMVKYGFSPVEALRTATVNAARCLGAEGLLGGVLPGARADLLVIDGDPLADINDAARIEKVMVDGHLYGVSELVDPFRETAATRNDKVHLPTSRRPARKRKGEGCCRTRPHRS